MIKKYTIEPGQPVPEELIKEAEDVAKYPITFDQDCPELSPAMIKAFKCLISQENRHPSNFGETDQ